MKVHFVRKSDNRKIGHIPCAVTERKSCPTSCPFYGSGCYAENGYVGIHWRQMATAKWDNLYEWSDFCAAVKSLPAGQYWRYGVAGDLPGVGETINQKQLQKLLVANRDKCGWTYTHKPVWGPSAAAKANRKLVKLANSQGFTINLSANNLAQVDKYLTLGIGPVTVTVPDSFPAAGGRTPKGNKVIVCPAQINEDLTCDKCRLCYKQNRTKIVGFRSHGSRKGLVNETVG